MPVNRERALAYAATGAAASATPTVDAWGDTRRLPVRDLSAPAEAYTQATINRDAAHTLMPGTIAGIAGDKDVALTATLPLRGASDDPDQASPVSGVSGATDPADLVNYQMDFLEAGGWKRRNLSATTITTGASTTSLPVAEKQYLFPNYSVVALLNPTTSKMEIAMVTANTDWDTSGTGTLTIAPALTFTPADDAVVYGCSVFYYADASPKAVELLDYQKDDLLYRVTGCRTALSTISSAPGEEALAEWNIAGLDWNIANAAGTLLTDNSLIGTSDIPTMTHPAGVLGSDARFFYGNTKKNMAGCEIDFGADWQPQTGNTTNGKFGHFLAMTAPVMTIPTRADNGYATDFAANTSRSVMVQLGNQPGRTVVVLFPNGKIENYPGRGEVSGEVGQNLAIKGHVADWSDSDMVAATGLPQCPSAILFMF